jgi:hypothetical protein
MKSTFSGRAQVLPGGVAAIWMSFEARSQLRVTKVPAGASLCASAR